MKIIGAILILSASLYSGFIMADRFINKLKSMKRAENLLKNVILALRKENMTVSEIFGYASFYDGNTGVFLEEIIRNRFSDIGKTAKECGFCSDVSVNRIIAEAFSVLGKFSAEEQIKEIEFCRERINGIIEKKEEQLTAKANLCRKAGIISGVFFLIIFL